MSVYRPTDFVPCTYVMEVFEFQAGDPAYQHMRPDGVAVPLGRSIAALRQTFGGEEGDFTGPAGEKYHLSLAPWQGKDQEKTQLQMAFHITPFLPVDVAPELRSTSFSISDKTTQQGASLPSSAPIPPVDNIASMDSPAPKWRLPSESALNRKFISCSDVRREHRIKIQQSEDGKIGINAGDLLNLPLAAMTEIQCPVCDTFIKFSEPFATRLQRGIEWWGEDARVQLIFDHPVSVAETRAEAADQPFVVHRYWRFPMTSAPTRPRNREEELSVKQKVHDHVVALTVGAGETTAQALLALPEAKQTILFCPLCDESLPVEEPYERYIRIFMDDAGDDTIHLQWSISHPSDQAETEVPLNDAAISATRHTSDDEWVQKRREGSASFVVRKKK